MKQKEPSRHSRLGAIVVSSLFLLVTYSMPLSAQNLVINATFDNDLSDWQVGDFNVVTSWDQDDADGRLDSGSVYAIQDGSNTGTEMVLQCVPVEPETVYSFGGDLHIIEQASTSDSVMILLYPKVNVDCSGAPIDGESAFADISENGSWIRTSSTITTPVSTQAIDFRVIISKTADGTLRGAADNIWLIDEVLANDPVFDDGFENN